MICGESADIFFSPAARIPVSSRWTAELCSDKEGVVLTGLFDIGQMNSGEKLSTKLQIKYIYYIYSIV